YVIEVFTADDAVMTEDRVVDGSGMRQRARMRRGGASPGLGAADLSKDQGFAGGRRLVGDGAEAGGIADAFGIGEEHVCPACIDQPVDVIMRFEAGLVAGAGLIGKTQLPRPATVQKGEGQGAALAADRDRAALAA